MFSSSLTFPKISAKNIYYSGQKAGETNIAHMVNNEVLHPLKAVYQALHQLIVFGEFTLKTII